MGANFVYEMLYLLVVVAPAGVPLLGAKPAALSWGVLSCLCAQWGLFGGSIYLSLRNIKHLCNQQSDHIDNRFWLKSEEARIKTIEGTPTTLEEERHYVARVRAEEWVSERMRIIK